MTDLTTLRRKRGNIQGCITSFKRILEAYQHATPEQRKPFSLQASLDGLKERFAGFYAIQDSIEEQDESECAKRQPMLDIYDEAIGEALRLLHESQPATRTMSDTNSMRVASPSQATVQVKLPQMDLPKFDGTIEKWHDFFDLFSSLVDRNDDLSAVQKLQYLRSSLTGRAASAINSLSTNDQNYSTAIDILKRKFDNVRQVLERHYTILLEYPRLQSDTPRELGDLVDCVNQHVRALKNMGQPIEAWDLPLGLLIKSKLAAEIKRNWEITLPDSELPSYTNLLEFLEKRARCSDPATSNVSSRDRQEKQRSKKGGSQGKGITMVTTKIPPCPICGETDHGIMRCEKFRQLTVVARYDAAKAAALCINCLRPNHKSSECPSTRNCSTCQKRHNSLLHRTDTAGGNAVPASSSHQS